MDEFHQRLVLRAATIDEILSNDFEVLPGQKADADLATRRLAAWCRASCSGDWSLFNRRLERDGLSIAEVLARFSTVRPRRSASKPGWVDDAIWVMAELQGAPKSETPFAMLEHREPCAFEQLLMPVLEKAEALLWTDIEARVADSLRHPVRTWSCHRLLLQLSNLSAPAIYAQFDRARNAGSKAGGTASLYDQFVSEMRGGGFRRLFESHPVLLRLMATAVRQWIDATREFVLRLHADLPIIRGEMLRCSDAADVVQIEGGLSDPHHGGRSVQIVRFEDGSGIVYKPKELALDTAWHGLVERLNRREPPIRLRSARVIPKDGYGWVEFIEHQGCADPDGIARFFQRAGAWLALFHCFASADMHHENIIAAGDHPVPIDLEMLLQGAVEKQDVEHEGLALESAMETIRNTVTTVGLLPVYFRSPNNDVFSVGGLASDWNHKSGRGWEEINSDRMRPGGDTITRIITSNLPHVVGNYARFSDHVHEFIAGFEEYARFLKSQNTEFLLGAFAGLSIRKVLRPTRFYYMLLRRLQDHRVMDDGVVWSAQADFLARLTDWENDADPVWPLQSAERAALLTLNVPHFVASSDGCEIRDNATGASARIKAISGMQRARACLRNLDEWNIAWQAEIIRENTSSALKPLSAAPASDLTTESRCDGLRLPTSDMLLAEVDRIAKEIADRAVRKGPSAAWIGLDWLGDGEFAQLTSLGPDLYNGVSGIGLFLAAHSQATGSERSAELALAAVSHLRKGLKGRNGARLARLVGVGGAMGLGSIIYAFAVMSKCLNQADLLADAVLATELFNDDLIAADKQLDVLGGSAGAILALLRLYRDTGADEILQRATSCGKHLLAQRRLGLMGQRSWVGQGSGPRALNGMSHGAGGFAYALGALATAAHREDFHEAALECIAYENSSYDADRHNWPTWPIGGETRWICQWCHGGAGIGMSRIGVKRSGVANCKHIQLVDTLERDIRHAVDGVYRTWPSHLDTLCCGTLGAVEFLCEAGDTLGESGPRDIALQQLAVLMQRASSSGDYRWNTGAGRYNLGLFRGLAGAGYTFLRRVESALPDILLWE